MRSILKIIFSLIAVISVLNASAQSRKYTLEVADSLFKQYQLDESHKAYLEVGNNLNYSDSIRIKAYEKYAEQDWRFYKGHTDALSVLSIAEKYNIDLCGINLLRTKITLGGGDYDEAKAYAEKSLSQAHTDQDRIDAAIEYARVIHNKGFDNEIKKQKPDMQSLKKASTLLNNVLQKQPGNSDASELLVGISLLLKDGDAVLNAWKSYYLVSNEQKINQVLKPGYELLKAKLRNWKGKGLSVEAIKTIAIGFADTKFFDYAAFMANEVKKKDAHAFTSSNTLKDIVAYADYIEDVKKVDAYLYPQVALGKKNYQNEYDSLIDIAGKKVWNKLSFINKIRKYDPDSLYDISNRKYDMEGYTGTTVNYYGMLMGHIIHKELKQVNQYGYSTKFTYISVDRLMSRDFTSWYGTTNVGGWGDSTTIIQVRKAYMTEPFQLLYWVSDSAENKKIRDEIAKKKAADFDVCKKDPYAEPKFLAEYLKFKEASKIYKHLTDSGLKGTQLNIAFIGEIFRLTIASTVFAHEGRHAIDQLYSPKEFKLMSDDERELRAKYSEVIFSLDPKMAFTGSIMGSDLDENTNHGKANKRFRKIIVDWMTAHENEITGLDKNTPLLMQFDLLTNAQLIAICKSADPFAKGKGD